MEDMLEDNYTDMASARVKFASSGSTIGLLRLGCTPASGKTGPVMLKVDTSVPSSCASVRLTDGSASNSTGLCPWFPMTP